LDYFNKYIYENRLFRTYKTASAIYSKLRWNHKCKSHSINVHVFATTHSYLALSSFSFIVSRISHSPLRMNERDAPIRRRIPFVRCNNSALFRCDRGWFNVHCNTVRTLNLWRLRPSVTTGMTVTTTIFVTPHYAVTIFINASFYGLKKRREREKRSEAVGMRKRYSRTLRLPALIVWKME